MIYKNAPIREAIFDIRTNTSSCPSEHLEEITKIIKDDFPKKENQMNVLGEFTLQKDGLVSSNHDSSFRGYLFSSSDNKRKVQFRKDGFTYNMLTPYTSWKDLSSNAFKLWKIYRQILSPKKISRIALRYVNNFNLPLPLENFQKYFVNVPSIPSNLPKNTSKFFSQIEISVNKSSQVIITQTIGQSTNKILPYILDIDAFMNFNQEIQDLEIENYFQQLRKLKNDTFEHSITEKARDLIS